MEGAAVPLHPVCYAHSSRAANQAPAHATVRPEHAYSVAEEGRRDRDPMCGGFLHTHGRRQGGVYRGGEDLQILVKDVGPVRRRLVGVPLKFC